MLQIVPATPADTPEITALIHALADYERLAHECFATEAQVHATLFGARPAAEVVLARRDGTTAGFALFFPNYSTFLARPGLWLEDLFVRPEHRGHGIGRALLAWLAAEVVRRGGGRLEWAVLDWNESAIGFYESLGARGMTEWTTYRVTGEALTTLAASA
ncbi:MAG: GNAT family N-acetyltransferase [Gemmatimonadaceae bacterium]|nr:GNAT family N-acetyltransferase [Gemmatimonadaceae bacterium]